VPDLAPGHLASAGASVRGAIVSDDGSSVKNDFAISHSTGDAASPTVDFDGTNFLVAWGDAPDRRLWPGRVSVAMSLLGAVFAFLAGLVALKWLSNWLENGRWYWFGIYCLVASAVVFWLHIRGY